MDKIYLFESVFYDNKTDIQYAGTDGKKPFRKLEDAIAYGDKIHKLKIDEFSRCKSPFTHEVKEFNGRIKRRYILKDDMFLYVNTIEELTLV